MTEADVVEASKNDVGSLQLNEDAIDACAVVFGSEIGRDILKRAKKARGEEEQEQEQEAKEEEEAKEEKEAKEE